MARGRDTRNLNLGDKHGEGKKERLARRAATKDSMREAEEAGLAGVAVGLAAVRTRDGPALNFAGGCAEIKDDTWRG
jgi:hypothetical protein